MPIYYHHSNIIIAITIVVIIVAVVAARAPELEVAVVAPYRAQLDELRDLPQEIRRGETTAVHLQHFHSEDFVPEDAAMNIAIATRADLL